MSLVDRTNERVHLSMEGYALGIDVDSDSDVHPEPWVWFLFEDAEENGYKITLAEATLIRDRLNLILGVDTQKPVE